MTAVAPSPGDLLRGWRTRRRRSQMDLALGVGVSTRHLSYVETGRSRASRELLTVLAEHLEIPLRERNAMFIAAGYAPPHSESRLDADALDAVREALGHLLAGHEPFPALVLDRAGDVVLANRAADVFLGLLGPRWSTGPLNVYRVSVHPDGLAPHIRNLPQWSGHLMHRLARLADLTGDPRLADLLAELHEHVPDPVPPTPAEQIVLPLHLAVPDGRELHFYSTVTHFGAAFDVTVDELSVETFVPADTATRDALRSRAPNGPSGPGT